MKDNRNLALAISKYFVEREIGTFLIYTPSAKKRMSEYQVNIFNDSNLIIFASNEKGWDITNTIELKKPITKEEFEELNKEALGNISFFTSITPLIGKGKDKGKVMEVTLQKKINNESFNREFLDTVYDFLLNKTPFINKNKLLKK